MGDTGQKITGVYTRRVGVCSTDVRLGKEGNHNKRQSKHLSGKKKKYKQCGTEGIWTMVQRKAS